MRFLHPLIFLFLCIPTFAELPQSQESSFKLGLHYSFLYPNYMPHLAAPTGAVAVSFGMPLLGNTLETQISYGKKELFELWLAELGYKLEARTPFFKGFASIGGHYLRYSKPTHTFWGPNAGIGIVVMALEKVEATAAAKIYFQDRNLVCFTVGFNYLL